MNTKCLKSENVLSKNQTFTIISTAILSMSCTQDGTEVDAALTLTSLPAKTTSTCLRAFKRIFIDTCQEPEWSLVLTGRFILYPTCTVPALRSWLDDQIVHCEHLNCALWFYITDNLLIQQELEINNNIFKIIRCSARLRPPHLWFL